MNLGLEDKVCAVTGASSGIGFEVTRELCAAGARVLMVSRDPEQLAAMAEVVRAEGGEVAVLVVDLTEEAAAGHVASAARQAFGPIDVLVNNAGVSAWRPVEEAPEEDFRKQFELSVMAPLRLMRETVPGMAERGWGRVVNVSSTAGKNPSPMMPDYSVGKAAMLSLSRLFGERYAAEGVLVNAICPGPTTSELWMAPGALLDQVAEASESTREEAASYIAGARPIDRMANPEEAASVITFLCSERASFVAGAAWSADGGTSPGII